MLLLLLLGELARHGRERLRWKPEAAADAATIGRHARQPAPGGRRAMRRSSRQHAHSW